MNSVKDGNTGSRVRRGFGLRCDLALMLVALGSPPAVGQIECQEQQELTASDAGLTDAFGYSVSMSGDTAVVGTPLDRCVAGSNCGSAYVFRFNGTSWIEEQKLTASDGAGIGRFGWSVSVSGNTAVIGANGGDCPAGFACGSAYVFRFNGTSWIEEQELTASDAAVRASFGTSVSVNGNMAVVGAPFDDCTSGGVGCGSAYVFRFDGTSWVEEQKLTASDAAADEFGISVSADGSTVVIGASLDHRAAGSHFGAAYVFRFNGSSWVEEQKLTASDAHRHDAFGRSVSVSGDTALVGAGHADCGAGGEDCGAAYVFRFNGTSWVEEQKLVASDAAAEDVFGGAVSVNGNMAVVETPFDDCAAGGLGCGAAYVFRYNGVSWVEEQKLTASDATASDVLGGSVSVSGATTILGARGVESAYVFSCAAVGPKCTELQAYWPPNCSIDARQPSTIDGATLQGWNSLEVTVLPTACTLATNDLTVNTMPADSALDFTNVSQVGNVATIMFDSIIPVRNWTCVSLAADPAQQACLGNLPGDVNNDGSSNPALDLVALIDCINALGSCFDFQENIRRTGSNAGVLDINRLIDLFNGAGAYESWTGASLDGLACPSE